jgi:hypothetical protein
MTEAMAEGVEPGGSDAQAAAPDGDEGAPAAADDHEPDAAGTEPPARKMTTAE